MPLVRIEMRAGKPAAYKKAVLDGVHEALVQAIKIPDHDRNQRLYELDADHFEISPTKSENAVIIEIVMFKGRSAEAKKRLFQAVVANLGKNPGIDGNDIIIVLHEPPLENWGIRGGKPADEVDLGFDIKV
ncbi:MAG: tautomerase family protein [Bacillota bacterium]|uniref:tautomerase family protein n=1 Tax=Desulforudis sp. DRI-14 TaxID=3459793 RepID=UPI00348733E8